MPASRYSSSVSSRPLRQSRQPVAPKTNGSNVSTAAQITQAWWLPSRLSPPNANSENQLCRTSIVTPAVNMSGQARQDRGNRDDQKETQALILAGAGPLGALFAPELFGVY